MNTTIVSYNLPSAVSLAAPQGTQKPKNKTDEAAQKKLSELSATATATALIIPNPIRKFKDGTSPVSYELFCNTVHHVLETYNSETSHSFVPPISGLIAEFAADDDLTAPISSIPKLTTLQLENFFEKQNWSIA